MLYGSVGRVGLRALLGTTFSPLSLFASGEQGVWYQNSDFSTLFQDAAGTTPVTALEQPVGLRLDKSKGLVLGSELVTNGDFSNGTTGYTANVSTIAVVSGELECNITGAGGGFTASGMGSIVAGKTYLVSLQYRNGTLPSAVNLQLGSVTALMPFSATTAERRYRITATSTQKLTIVRTSDTGTIYFDNISVRELPGNHAFQTTNSARPVLSARYNLLTRTEEFDNAAWTAVGLASRTKSGTAPDGTSLWNILTEDTATSAHCVFGTSFPTTAGVIYTVSVYVKAGTRRYVSLRGFFSTTGNAWITFDTVSPSINANAFVTNSGYESLGGGVYRIWLTSNVQTTKSNDNIVIAGSDVSTAPVGGSATGNSYLGDGSTIIAWGADVRVANESSALPAYQRVGAATYGSSTSVGNPDYDTTGFPPYLLYDGGDWMQTNSINFTATDKMSVFAGVRKLSDADVGFIVELSPDFNTNNGSFGLWSGDLFGASARYTSVSKGSAASVASSPSTYPAPNTNILTMIGDISGDVSQLRVNAILASSNTADQGTGNFGNYPLYFGARGGTSFRFNGRDYGFVIVGRAVNAAELAGTENYMDIQTFGRDMQLIYSDELTTATGDLITAADGDQIYMTVAYQ